MSVLLGNTLGEYHCQRHCAEFAYSTRRMGNSPESKLHEAVYLGQEDKAQQLMAERRKKMRSKYLNPNEVYSDNPEMNTLLLSAASIGFEDIYTELADMELKCNIRNGLGQNLLHVLCNRSGRPEWRMSETRIQKRRRMLEWTLSHQKCKAILPQLLTEKDQVSIIVKAASLF